MKSSNIGGIEQVYLVDFLDRTWNKVRFVGVPRTLEATPAMTSCICFCGYIWFTGNGGAKERVVLNHVKGVQCTIRAVAVTFNCTLKCPQATGVPYRVQIRFVVLQRSRHFPIKIGMFPHGFRYLFFVECNNNEPFQPYSSMVTPTATMERQKFKPFSC